MHHHIVNGFQKISHLGWNYHRKYQKLLGRELNDLNRIEYLQRCFCEMVLRFFNARYRKSFRRFELSIRSNFQHVVCERKGLVFVIGTLGPGGSERQAVLTLCHLAKRLTQPTALIAFSLSSEPERFFLSKLESEGIPVYELNRDTNDKKDMFQQAGNAMVAAGNLPPELADVAKCIRILEVLQPAMVHIWLDETNIKAGLASVALGIPKIVLGTRSLPPIHFALHQPYMLEGYRWLARQAGVVILNNSEIGARAYERWLNLPVGHVRIVRNGFDFNNINADQIRMNRAKYRSRHGIPFDAPLIGTVIRLSEEKRPFLWAEIAAKVRHILPDAHFLVVGDGPLRFDLEFRAAKPDLSDAFHIVGHEKDAIAAIAAMDLFLLTSRAEGLPNVLVEAQSLGVPVITTNAGGACEAVDHGYTGWVLKNDDPQYAAYVIANLMLDLEWRKKTAKAAKEYVRRRFELNRMIDNTLEVYGAHLKMSDRDEFSSD